MGEKTQQNFLIIDSQYNAKRSLKLMQKILSEICATLSPSSLTADPKLVSQNEQVSCVSKRGASLLIYIRLAHVKCLFTGKADFSNWVVITTFILIQRPFNIFWGRLLILPITIVF
jgi:hypothetical protein